MNKPIKQALALNVQPLAALPEARILIPIVGRARIFAVLVTQKAGSNDGFTFSLSGKYACCPTNYPTLDATPPTTTDAAAIYDVVGNVTAANTAANAVFRDSFGVPYANDANSTAKRVEEIYGKLVVTSPNDNKIFDIRIVYSEND